MHSHLFYVNGKLSNTVVMKTVTLTFDSNGLSEYTFKEPTYILNIVRNGMCGGSPITCGLLETDLKWGFECPDYKNITITNIGLICNVKK